MSENMPVPTKRAPNEKKGKARITMKKKINLMARTGLFALILSVGTMAALMAGETKGLALADLSGAPVRAVTTAARGEVLYAAVDGSRQGAGIYRSKDNGDTWRRVGSGPGVAVNALAVHPNQDTVLYAGTAGGPMATTDSLWRSIDGGRTWHKSALGLPASPDKLAPDVSALAVDPRRPEVLYVGTAGHGVYRFDLALNRFGYELMGGVSLYRAHVNGLVVGPEGRVYALTNEGLFVTEGGTWQELSVPEMAASLAVAPDDPRRLYVGGVSTGIYRSTDAGQSWERVSTGMEMIPGVALRVTALTVDKANPRHVVAATSYGVGNRLAPGGIYESTDGAYSWTKLADAGALVTQLTSNQGIIYAMTEGGLARYDEPAKPAPARTFPHLRSGLPVLRRLADPSGVQILILALTLSLAGLALVGRVEWVLHRKSQTVQN